jgi:hypothetical protein
MEGEVHLLAGEGVDALHNLGHEKVPEKAALRGDEEFQGFPRHATRCWPVVWLRGRRHGTPRSVAASANCRWPKKKKKKKPAFGTKVCNFKPYDNHKAEL